MKMAEERFEITLESMTIDTIRSSLSHADLRFMVTLNDDEYSPIVTRNAKTTDAWTIQIFSAVNSP